MVNPMGNSKMVEQRLASISNLVVRLLRLGGHAKRVQELRFADQKKASYVCMEELEETEDKGEKAHWTRVPPVKAYESGYSRKSYWRIFKSPTLHRALGNSYGSSQGLKSLF